MGILSGIATGLGTAIAGIPGAIAGGLVDTGINWLTNKFISKPNSARAFDASYDVYKTRYQDTMADMRAAGLNPILAAGSGGFNVGSPPEMKLPTLPTSQASSAFANLAQGQKAGEETKTEKVRQLKILAGIKETFEKIYTERVRRGLMKAEEQRAVRQGQLAITQAGRIFHEIAKLGADQKLSEEKTKYVRKQIEAIILNMKQLKQTSDWYDGVYGDFLGWVRSTFGAFGALLGPLPAILK